MPKNYRFETLQLHVGQETADPATDARAVPIYASTSYVFHNAQHAADRFGLRDPGNIYSRLTNPTLDVFERRISALEGGSAALSVASGAAALSCTIQALAAQGEHIVSSKTIYGGTYNYLAHTAPLHGITTTFVDPYEKGGFERRRGHTHHHKRRDEHGHLRDSGAVFHENLRHRKGDEPRNQRQRPENRSQNLTENTALLPNERGDNALRKKRHGK